MTGSILEIAGRDVSRETMEKLKAFAALLEKWTKSINLIAPNSVPEIWERHIVDSAQILSVAGDDWKLWTDLGSGGGLPAIVVAILDQKDRPITLVESDKRKCLFLNTVRRELSLNMIVKNERIEGINQQRSSIVSARALAPLTTLISFAEELIEDDGKALFLKGARYQEELDNARKSWQFEVSEHPSQTNPDSRILEISRIQRREH